MRRLTPKLVIALREGYSFRRFGHDALAGLTVSNVGKIAKDFEDGSEEIGETLSDLKDPESVSRADVPLGVEVYEIAGPFFFGVADRLKDTLNQFERPPRVFVLRMRKVPAIDATGLHALKEFHTTRRRRHIRLKLCGVHAQSLFAIVQAGFDRLVGAESMFETLHDALGAARGPVAREASGVGAP